MLNIQRDEIGPYHECGRSEDVVDGIDPRMRSCVLPRQSSSAIGDIQRDFLPLETMEQSVRGSFFIAAHSGEDLGANQHHAPQLVASSRKTDQEISGAQITTQVIDEHGRIDQAAHVI